jgi:lipoprotein NlpI
MWDRLFRSLTIIFILLHGSCSAWAGSAIALQAVVHNCQDVKLDPDTRIAACSEMIHSGLASRGILTAFYFYRSLAYEAKGDIDNAVRDNDKALELKPDYPDALANKVSLQNKIQQK